MFKRFLLMVLVLVVLAGTAYWYFIYRPVANTYQAVFLSNGQVYFGKLHRPKSTYATLTDIYYMVVQKPLQEAEGGEPVEGEVTPEEEGETTETPKYTLVKLGRELHGPQDEMRINRKHILFYENLKDDSKVVTAIKTHKEGSENNE